MKLKFYYYVCFILFLGFGFVACIREDTIGTAPKDQEELLLQKAEIWYQQNLDFAKTNKSSGIDVRVFQLNWKKKEFIKNQSGNTIISIPVEGVIPGYTLGVMNFLLTKEGEPLGVFKVYKEDPYQQDTEMAFYSGTGQLIVQGYYNYKRGTFLVPEDIYNPVAGIRSASRNKKKEVEEKEIEEVIITNPKPIQPIYPITPWIRPTNPSPRPPDSGFPATPGGGGGGPNPGSNPGQTDPCSKAKAVTSKDNVKKAIENLKTKMDNLQKKNNNEQIYILGKDGSTKVVEGEQNHVKFSPDIYTQGSVHDHDKLGYPMFPPHDINAFINTVRVQNYPPDPNDKSDKSGEAFLGIVTPNHNYFMTFNGTKDDIPPMWGAGVVNKYQEEFGLQLERYKIYNGPVPDNVLQQIFFEYLDKMGLSGKISLIKQINGNNYPITKNPDGTINNNSTNPCKN